MNINQIVFFDLIAAILILSLTLIAIVIYFAKTLKKSTVYKNELENLKFEIEKKNSLILQETREKTIRLMDEANNNALDIIQKANLFTNVSKEDFDQELKKVTSNQVKTFENTTSSFIELYGNVLNDLKSKNIEIFQNVSKSIEISTLEEIKKFKETIEQETISSEKMLKKKVEHEYLLAKKDIDTYKQEQLQIVNDHIYEILERTTRLIMGKALNLADQETLILQSLEEAKKKGIFNSEK